jgi:hypothetical protein
MRRVINSVKSRMAQSPFRFVDTALRRRADGSRAERLDIAR